MKTKQSWIRRSLLLGAIAISSALVLSSCDKDDDDPIPQANYTISGNASGAQEVPAVTGTGTGTITGTYNPNTGVLDYTTTWTGLTGAPTSAGFYSGASGAAGVAVGSPWTLASGLTETGTHTGTITLTGEQAQLLTTGGFYYSLGTTTNPTGEVRGQITATR